MQPSRGCGVRSHPSINSFAGGVHGAYERFDLDYWAAAATVAVHRLAHTLDHQPSSDALAKIPPGITICIGYREALVAPLLRRPWRIEVDPDKADYIVATERWRCAEKLRDATAEPERTFAAGKPIERTRVRITDAGRRALGDDIVYM